MRDILGYEGQYSVTKNGKIYSHKRKRFLKPTNLKGYQRVKLRDSKNNQKRSEQLVHRLVAKTYIPNPNNKLEINHKNYIRDDNRIENLEWCTRIENVRHSIVNRPKRKNINI